MNTSGKCTFVSPFPSQDGTVSATMPYSTNLFILITFSFDFIKVPISSNLVDCSSITIKPSYYSMIFTLDSIDASSSFPSPPPLQNFPATTQIPQKTTS
jgi:hypothetical protein